MPKHWGFIDASENAALESIAVAFSSSAARVKTFRGCEPLVRRFMREYLRIGDDPTDTVIRDNVWVFLLKKTKHAMSERQLHGIWEEEVARHSRACVIS